MFYREESVGKWVRGDGKGDEGKGGGKKKEGVADLCCPGDVVVRNHHSLWWPSRAYEKKKDKKERGKESAHYRDTTEKCHVLYWFMVAVSHCACPIFHSILLPFPQQCN